MSKAFPQNGISVVMKAPTTENAELATDALAQRLSTDKSLFPLVDEPDSGVFFERNGLLFGSLAQVRKDAEGLTSAQPLIATLTADPSLRGAMKVLSLGTEGVRAGKVKLHRLAWPLSLADRALTNVLAGKPATFSWQELLQGHQVSAERLRHFIEIQPILDFSNLQPGRKATEGIRRAASNLDLRGNTALPSN